MDTAIQELTPAQQIIAERMSEETLQYSIGELARALRWYVHAERPAVSRRGRFSTPIQGDAGFVDLVLAKHGKVIFIECKSQKGQATNAQSAWALQLCPHYYLARPEAWLSGEIERILKED